MFLEEPFAFAKPSIAVCVCGGGVAGNANPPSLEMSGWPEGTLPAGDPLGREPRPAGCPQAVGCREEQEEQGIGI